MAWVFNYLIAVLDIDYDEKQRRGHRIAESLCSVDNISDLQSSCAVRKQRMAGYIYFFSYQIIMRLNNRIGFRNH